MANQLSDYKDPLYLIVLTISVLVVIVATGPGLYAEISLGEWYMSWQKQVFDMLCHQQTNRSIHLSGVPMAVCSRCFGIYASFALTLLFIPLIPQSDFRNKWIIPLVLMAVTINVVDSVAYAFHIWENTLTSRFLTGCSIGTFAALLLGTERPKQTKELIKHGTK